MTTYIFAIGGTGARVMRSLTMLLAAGCHGAEGNEIVPVILDYDTENGDKDRTVKVMNKYKELHDIIYSGVAFDNKDKIRVDSFFGMAMNQIRDKRAVGAVNTQVFDSHSGFAAYIPQGDTKITFEQYLGFNQMIDETWPTHELLKAMYDVSPEKQIDGSDNPRAEINLNLDKGFKGCPNIGCIVTKNFANLPEYKNVLTCFTPGDRIFIIGSVFGGTGASGIPTLLDLLREDPRTRDASIGVLAMMPYYKIENNTNGAISSDTFLAKAKAAVTAYDLKNSVYQQVNDIYFIGDNDMRASFAYAEGKGNQKNDALFAEFAGAMCVLDFISGAPNQYRGRSHEMSLQDNAPVTPPIVPAGFVPNNGSVLESHFYGEKEKYIYPLTKMVLFEKFCKEFVSKGESIPKSEIWYWGEESGVNKNAKLIGQLISFADDLFAWLNEMDGTSRPISLYKPKLSYDDFLVSKKLAKGKVIKKHAFKEDNITQLLCNAFRKHEGQYVSASNYLFIRCAYDAFQNILDKINNFKID